MIFKREGARRPAPSVTVTLPARTVLVAAGTTPNIMYEKEYPGTFELDARKKFFQPHTRRAGRRRPASRSTPDANGFFTSYDARRPVRHLLRRQPPALRRQRRQGDGVGQGRLPARRRAVRRRAARRSIRAGQPARDARVGARCVRALDDELTAARRGRRAPDADDRRGRREGAGGGAALPARAVLPAAELRDAAVGSTTRRRGACRC